MTDLIRRLEEAKEGSRELSLLVDMRLNPDKWFGSFEIVTSSYDWLTGACEPTHYTTNLQDAVSAVPEGCTRSVDATLPQAGIDVELYRGKQVFKGTHDKEAIATCIAILRAMEAKNE